MEMVIPLAEICSERRANQRCQNQVQMKMLMEMRTEPRSHLILQGRAGSARAWLQPGLFIMVLDNGC